MRLFKSVGSATVAAVALLFATPAGAMTLDSPAPGARVDSRVTFRWTFAPGAFYGGILITTPATAVDNPCCTGTATSFTPPEPLGAGPHSWQGQEEVPGPDETSVVQRTAAQRFIVVPSIKLAPLKLSWKGDTSSDLNRPQGSRMTITRRFTDSNLYDAYETTTVTRDGRRVFRVQGQGATHGENFLSPLTRTATFSLPTLTKGRYKVSTEIREGRTASGPVRARATGTLVVTRTARGYGRKSLKPACGGVDNRGGVC